MLGGCRGSPAGSCCGFAVSPPDVTDGTAANDVKGAGRGGSAMILETRRSEEGYFASLVPFFPGETRPNDLRR
jgi:hypothetical protein